MQISDIQRQAFMQLIDFAATIDRLNRWAQNGLLTDAELRYDLADACKEHGAALLDAVGAFAPPHT